MSALLWILGAIVINAMIGCMVGATIDDDEERWLKWVSSCPLGFSFGVSLWPVWLWLWWRDSRGGAA